MYVIRFIGVKDLYNFLGRFDSIAETSTTSLSAYNAAANDDWIKIISISKRKKGSSYLH
jgi:hypothetical protein